jgi:hypothetical protein
VNQSGAIAYIGHPVIKCQASNQLSYRKPSQPAQSPSCGGSASLPCCTCNNSNLRLCASAAQNCYCNGLHVRNPTLRGNDSLPLLVPSSGLLVLVTAVGVTRFELALGGILSPLSLPLDYTPDTSMSIRLPATSAELYWFDRLLARRSVG